MRQAILDLPQVKSHGACAHAAKQYHDYIVIRRDLRTADDLLSHVIASSDQVVAGRFPDNPVLLRAALVQAIMLYARWFKATTGKPKLQPDRFYEQDSAESATHVSMLKLRDRYIAHRELDLMGRDYIWAHFDDAGRFLRTDSEWIDQVLPTLEELRSYRNCVWQVHNKIDAEIIPEEQRKLNKWLRADFWLSDSSGSIGRDGRIGWANPDGAFSIVHVAAHTREAYGRAAPYFPTQYGVSSSGWQKPGLQ